MASLLCVGQSRSGKSTSMIEFILRDAGRVAMTICDPQFSLARMALLQLYLAGKEHHVRIIRLSNVERGFGFLHLRQSRAKNPLQRRQENDNELMNFARILLNRSSLNPSVNRLIWEWLSAGIRLVLFASKPLYLLPYSFQPNSDQYKEMMAHCHDPDTRDKMRQIASFSRSQLRTEVVPALRIAELCHDPAFIACCGSISFNQQLRKKRILIFTGDGANRETVRTLLIAAISKTIQFSERHDRRVNLFVDEFANWNLLTPEFGDAIASLQKNNLRFHLATQVLSGNKTVINKVVENCQIRRYHRLGDIRTIRLAASDIGTAMPQSTDRRRHTTDVAHELTQLPTGAYFEVNHGRVSRCHPPKPQEPYPWVGLTEKKITSLIRDILSSPEYHDVTTEPTEKEPAKSNPPAPNVNPTEANPLPTGESDMANSENNADDIPPPNLNSPTLSQRARRKRRHKQ